MSDVLCVVVGQNYRADIGRGTLYCGIQFFCLNPASGYRLNNGDHVQLNRKYSLRRLGYSGCRLCNNQSRSNSLLICLGPVMQTKFFSCFYPCVKNVISVRPPIRYNCGTNGGIVNKNQRKKSNLFMYKCVIIFKNKGMV